MRIHSLALLVLASCTAYVACTDSDSGTPGEGGGEAGEMTAGGSEATAGAPNDGGNMNQSTGGEAGQASLGGAAGSALGGAGAGGALGGAGAGGDGDGGPPADTPVACLSPGTGTGSPYTVLEGTSGDDVFKSAQRQGSKLIFGRDGNDTFQWDDDGLDCLVGGTGDDEFWPGKHSVVYDVGGSGADTFHLLGYCQGNNPCDSFGPPTIVDMTNEDTIRISLAGFNFLKGNVGDPPDAAHFHIIADYGAGGVKAPALVYDPNHGQLVVENNDGFPALAAYIFNAADYVPDINDFVLDP